MRNTWEFLIGAAVSLLGFVVMASLALLPPLTAILLLRVLL